MYNTRGNMKVTNIPNFKNGDIVKLVSKTCYYGVEDGNFAIVINKFDGLRNSYFKERYFDIKWIKRNQQVSGTYCKLYFQLMCSVKNRDCFNCKNRLLCLINGVKIKKEK